MSAPRIQRTCAECREVFSCSADEELPRCPKCGSTKVHAAIYCKKCKEIFGVEFKPVAPPGAVPVLELKPCPKCGTLDHVDLPESLKEFAPKRTE